MFLLPIPTIKEWILFVSVILIARFPKLPAKRLCSLEPRIWWQWWHQFCGFKRGFITIDLITVVCLTVRQRTLNRWSPMAHFVRFLFLRPQNFRHFSLWAQILGSSIDVSFGSAICSDVTNASTAETFFVSFTLSSSFAFAWFVTRFSEDFLAFPDFQAIQFSIFTFHRLVTTSMKVAIFITQISHHQ